MSKHTPAPWRLRRAETSLEHDFIVHAGPHIIAWSVPRGVRSNTRKKSEHIANARLIAAAPELLDALQEFLAWGEGKDCEYPGPKARAAISKVTGSKP